MNSFYPLKVEKIRQLTSNAVELKFEILSDLESKFNFQAGQYITIKQTINEEEVRRANNNSPRKKFIDSNEVYKFLNN